MNTIVARSIGPLAETPRGFAGAKREYKAARKNSDVSLSILIVTYNHEKYILKALQSISMQKLKDVPVEIVVADDSSTDMTRQIIADYFVANPIGPVRFLGFTRNRGVTRNYQRSWACLQTKYVAVMEGDDYWTDPCKLSKQIEFLENNGACVGCSANYLVGLEGKSQFMPRVQPEPSKVSYLDSRGLIHDNLIGNFSTCVYRVAALKTIPAAVYDTKSYDWIMNIALARWGPIAFFHDVMSVYRVHSSGTWSRMSDRQKLQSQIDQIREYDQLTSKMFTPEWDNLVARLQAELDRLAALENVSNSVSAKDVMAPADRSGVAHQRQAEVRPLTPESLTEILASSAMPVRSTAAGALVRKVYTSLPNPLLRVTRAMVPNVLREQIRKIGKS
jgi:glycosyltransferase involved in cell wall biosynthesis